MILFLRHFFFRCINTLRKEQNFYRQSFLCFRLFAAQKFKSKTYCSVPFKIKLRCVCECGEKDAFRISIREKK